MNNKSKLIIESNGKKVEIPPEEYSISSFLDKNGDLVTHVSIGDSSTQASQDKNTHLSVGYTCIIEDEDVLEDVSTVEVNPRLVYRHKAIFDAWKDRVRYPSIDL